MQDGNHSFKLETTNDGSAFTRFIAFARSTFSRALSKIEAYFFITSKLSVSCTKIISCQGFCWFYWNHGQHQQKCRRYARRIVIFPRLTQENVTLAIFHFASEKILYFAFCFQNISFLLFLETIIA